jgi:hypothetical protein
MLFLNFKALRSFLICHICFDKNEILKIPKFSCRPEDRAWEKKREAIQLRALDHVKTKNSITFLSFVEASDSKP